MKQFFKGALLVFLLTIGGYCANAAVVLSETHTNVSCYGGSNGTINLSATGTAPFVYVWNDSILLEDRSGLAAGTYTVIVFDALLSSDTLSVTINQPTLIVAAKAITPVSCGGGSDGAINLTITGGTPGYNVLWNDGVTTEDRTAITAFHYHFTVTDANGCVMNDSANVIQPMGMVPSISVNDANCNANNGNIDLTVQYGYPPYSFAWSDGPTTEDRNSLNIGTYTVTVTDNIACTVSMTGTVNQANTPMNINHTQTNVACFGGNTGSINITSVVGAPGPFSYAWSNSAITQNISTLTQGSYTLTVTSANSCTATKTINITEPAVLTVNTTATQPNCFNANNGAVTTSVSGGTPGYSYNWGGVSTQNRFGLADGTYTVTVTDNRGCTASSSKTITSPAQVVVTATATQLSCVGGSTGAVTTVVTGGTGTYSYWWGAGVTSANRTNLPAGTYTVTATDGNGCSATASAIISPYVPLTTSHTQVNNVCNNDSAGSINLSVSNGWLPYSFTWSNTAVTEDISNLKADTYTVTVTDNHACTVSRNVNITHPMFPIYLNGTVTDATCGGYNDGAISISPSSGIAPFSYIWSDSVTAQNRTALAAGAYSVTVTDNSGCGAQATFSINEPDAIAVMATATDATCNGTNTGSINLNVFGGYAPYTYTWNDTGNTQNRPNIVAGTYSVTVTDNHNCSTSITETVYQPTAIIATATITNATCFGTANGAIALQVSGGSGAHSFNWSDAATTQDRTLIMAGIYDVTITDMSACSTTASYTVTEPAAISITTAISNVSCNGNSDGSIDITATGGSLPYNFVWADGPISEDRTTLSAGTYTVNLTDNNMCTASATATINQPAALAISTTKTNGTCATGGSISISITGGTGIPTYSWSNNETTQNISNLSAGTYTVTATYSNGCSITASDSVAGTSPVAITHTKVDNTICFGDSAGSIDLTVTGGTGNYTYAWSNGANTEDISNLTARNYFITVTDAGNCSATALIKILQPSPVTLSTARNNVSCLSTANDGAVDLTVTGATPPYTYLWNTSATTEDLSNLTTGAYSVTVTDANSCSTSTALTIVQPSTIVITATKSNVLCHGGNDGSISVSATGGTGNYTYNWNIAPSATQLSNLSANNYVLTVTDTISGCRATRSINVGQPAVLQTLHTITNPSCFSGNNGSVALNTFGGMQPYSYTWSNAANTATASNLTAGIYSVTITDSNACSITASYTLTQPTQVVANVTTGNTCYELNNGFAAVNVSGGIGSYTYLWANGDTTQQINNLSDGSYAVLVKDSSNCQATGTAVVNRYAELMLNETHNNVTCNGLSTGAIQVTPQGGAGNYSFNWNNGVTGNLQNNIPAGSYIVSVNDAAGCSAQKTITITQPSPMLVSEQHTNYACNTNPGEIDLTIAGGTPPYFFRWSDNAISEDRSNMSAGTYQVSVSDYNSCNTVLPVTITTAQPLVLTTNATAPTCYAYSNGAITSQVTGGTQPYTYLWANGNTNREITGITAGTYALLVTDANNCSATQAIVLTQPQGILATAAVTPVTCYNAATGKIELSVTNGAAPYNFNWSNTQTSQDIVNINAGNYAVTITDASNCSVAVTDIDVLQPERLDVQADIIPAGCFANSAYGAINLTVNGGTAPFLYSWDNSATTEDISNLTAGNYFVAITDANGCLVTKANTVPQTPAIDLTATVKNTACTEVSTGAIELTVNGGVPEFAINWSNGGNTQNIAQLAAGTYSVTVSDISHCTAEATYNVETDYMLTAQAATDIESLVSGQAAQISVTTNIDNGNTYQWSSTEDVKCNTCAASLVKPSNTAAYTVLVTDQNGCTATDMVTVEVKQIKEIFIPNVFTPNNDANNDVFKIYGDMSTIALLDFKVFNRWGEKVYDTGDIEFAWDGTYKGELVDRGVYTYTLKIVYVNGVANDLYRGSITVLR